MTPSWNTIFKKIGKIVAKEIVWGVGVSNPNEDHEMLPFSHGHEQIVKHTHALHLDLT